MFARIARYTPALAMAALVACDTGTTDPVVTTSPLTDLRSAPVTHEWHQAARDLVAANSLNPLVAGRIFAALGMAQHQAVQMVDGQAGGGNGQTDNAVGRSEYEARRGAVAGASVRVLSFMVPAAAAALEQRLAAQAEAGQGKVHPQFTRGVAVGRSAGDALVQHLMTDRFTTPWDNRPIPTGAGFWTPLATPPGGGMMGQVEPYFLTSAAQFRPVDPPAHPSPAFDAALAEASAVMAAATPALKANAILWNYPPGTYGPLGFWNELASTYAGQANLDEGATAQVLALVSAAMFDALIACFEAKYHFWMIRPNQANPAITPLFGVPNYPSYPSGHQSISAAAARVLTHFFPERTAQIEALRAQASESRIIGGLHYRFDQDAARILGQQVGDLVIANGM